MSDAPGTPQRRERLYPKIGEWNVLEASVGARGMGKSTHQCHRAYELVGVANGAYVIGHSLGSRLPEKLPPELGGVTLPIRYYPTIERLERGLHRWPGDWHILSPPVAGDGQRLDAEPETADDLLQFSVRLSVQVRRRAFEQAHPLRPWRPSSSKTLGLRAPPILVLVDEGIAVEAASTGQRSREADRWFLEYLYSLRHWHIGLLYSIQDATARSWRVLEQATRIHCFRVRHQWHLQALEAAGASREQAAEIRALRRYEHVTIESEEVKATAPETPGTPATSKDADSRP